jgi:hypothetical protein
MVDLVIEITLVVMVLLPHVASSLRPARVANRSFSERSYCGRRGNARHGSN